MDVDLAEFAVDYAVKLGATYADARLESTARNGFSLKNGIPQVSGFDRSSGIGVRLVLDRTLGFVSTTELEKEKLKQLIARAAKTTKHAAKLREDVALSDEKTYTDSYEVRQKTRFDDVSPKEKLDVLFDIEKEIAATGINTPGRYISLTDFTTDKYFVNSQGTKIRSFIPRWDCFYFITINEHGESTQRYWQYAAAGGFETMLARELPSLLRDEVRTMARMATADASPEGKLDVVLAPQMVGIMVHEGVGHPHEADRIYGREAAQAGESYLTPEMFGKRIGSDVVSISDDPTIPGSFGYYLYDDEGVPARKKMLVRAGMNAELLHNRETAAAHGAQSNAGARATAFNREPIVRMSNSFVEKGDHREDELVEGVKHGVFIKNFTEWNIDDKRVNQKYVGMEAYRIENGRVTSPVRRPILEISTFDLWNAVDAVADNMEYHAGTCGKAEPMQEMPVWFGGPSLRLRNIRLSSP